MAERSFGSIALHTPVWQYARFYHDGPSLAARAVPGQRVTLPRPRPLGGLDDLDLAARPSLSLAMDRPDNVRHALEKLLRAVEHVRGLDCAQELVRQREVLLQERTEQPLLVEST